MFHILTGKPGSSKTLHAVEIVEKMRAQARKDRNVERPVYYWNIGDVTLDGWTPLGDPSTFDLMGVDPDKSAVWKWFELPHDSIIVIDECQKLWPKRPQGSAAPLYVSNLETHRKAGYDIIALSQDPTLIDNHVRKLCGLHTHYRRVFNTENYHSWTWEAKCVTDVESTSEQNRAQQEHGRFNKKYYGTYRSANVHNVKARPPWKWIATLAAALVLVPVLVYVAMGIVKPDEPTLTQAELDASLQRQQKQTVDAVVTHVKSLMESNPWDARLHKDRVANIEMSKPFYDELVRPVAFPKIRGCGSVVIGEKIDCFCTSQQGTRLEVSTRECLRYIKYGWFDFTRPDQDEQVPDSGSESLGIDSATSPVATSSEATS